MSEAPRAPAPAPAAKHLAIASALRAQIASGQLAPGGRLPTCLQLERRHRASRMTVLKALAHLKRDQFVRTDGRRGSFVVDRPPQLFRYALVFANRQLSLYERALFEEAEQLQRDTPRRVPAYFGVDGHTDVEDYQRLLDEVRRQRLAGIVLISHPSLLAGTPLLAQPGLPRVALVERPDVPGVSGVALDTASYLHLALRHFRARGRRRLAVLTNAHRSPDWVAALRATAVRYGVTTHPAWILGADPRFPHWAVHCVAALLQGARHERPDGLLIADDHLVEHATRGLLELGYRVPRDVEVLAHANFPCLPPAAVPVTWIGYRARRVLDAALETVDRLRAGRRAAAPALIPAELGAEDGARHAPAKTGRKETP